jgi:hypothetical protein
MPWAFQRTKRLAFSKSLLDQILVMPGRPSTVDPRIEVRRRLEVLCPSNCLTVSKLPGSASSSTLALR